MRRDDRTRVDVQAGSALGPDRPDSLVQHDPRGGFVDVRRWGRESRLPRSADPLGVLRAWIDEGALHAQGDANAMVLATATPDGSPSARVVLCKAIEDCPPAAVFYTNYGSRKGQELDANPRAAAVFHWPLHGRQARIEGRVVRTSDAESDMYFAGRPFLSRLGAIASSQSRPLTSRAELIRRVFRAAVRPGAASLRPKEWGGYRMLIERVELWCAGRGRLHDRTLWIHTPNAAGPEWTSSRLYP